MTGGDEPRQASGGPRILCFAGPSGSGKTTLIRRLVDRLPVPPRRTGLLKHTHHRIDWHPAGTDSAMLWDRGPGALGVAGPDQTAVFLPSVGGSGHRLGGTPPTRRLIRACRRLPDDLELVLAEGFSDAEAPTVWTVDEPGAAPSVPGLRGLAVAAEHLDAWSEDEVGVPVFSRDDLQRLAARVMDWAAPLSSLPVA